MRPHTQLSFELCMWVEGASVVPPWILWCSCLLTFWGLEWLSLSGMRSGTLSFYGSPQIYLLKVLLCVSAPCQVSLWSQANSLTEHAPEPSSSWSEFCHLSSHTPPCSSPWPLGKSFQPAPKPYVFPPWWILNSPGLGVNPLQSLPPIFPLLVALFSGMTSRTSIRTFILFFCKYLFTRLSLQIASPLRALWMA